MKKLYLFLITLVLALTFPSSVHAATARPSATLITPFISQQKVEDNRAKILEGFLKNQNSPLAPYAKTFVDEADKNNLDWKLVPAIAGLESSFGIHIPSYSYNGWGYGVYGTNVRRFDSWEDGIAVVSKALREDYMNKWGATNIPEIGAKYAASPTWAYRVQNFMDQIEAYEAKSTNKSLHISL